MFHRFHASNLLPRSQGSLNEIEFDLILQNVGINNILSPDEWIFKIKSNRFLRNMVRAIVGSLIEIGLGKKRHNDFKKIIESRDRKNAGFSVPAKALFLTEIDYPRNIFLSNEN